jgi:hypothetical protein
VGYGTAKGSTQSIAIARHLGGSFAGVAKRGSASQKHQGFRDGPCQPSNSLQQVVQDTTAEECCQSSTRRRRQGVAGLRCFGDRRERSGDGCCRKGPSQLMEPIEIAGRNADRLGWWSLRFEAVHSIADSSRTSPPSTATEAPWLGDRLKGGGSEVGWPRPQASGPPVWLWSMPGFRVDNLGEMSSQRTRMNTIL